MWHATTKYDHHLIVDGRLVATAHDSGDWSIAEGDEIPRKVAGRSGTHRAAGVPFGSDEDRHAYLLASAKHAVHRVLLRAGWTSIPASIEPTEE